MAIKVGQNGFLTIDKLNCVSCRVVAINKRTSEITVMTTQCVGAQPSGIRYIVKPYEYINLEDLPKLLAPKIDRSCENFARPESELG